jgi:hypothetical protein
MGRRPTGDVFFICVVLLCTYLGLYICTSLPLVIITFMSVHIFEVCYKKMHVDDVIPLEKLTVTFVNCNSLVS